MSGPLSTADVAPDTGAGGTETGDAEVVEVLESRQAEVGSFVVRRALPRRGRRTVGAWCFVDHMGPAAVTQERGLDIGPHPHMGLQTVTWLLRGEVLHRDSLGSEQVIRPGQLNLMTAGHGVSHAEEATGSYRGRLHGVQLWVAQPSETRNGLPAFEHHAALPQTEIGRSTATVLIGDLAGISAPSRRDTEHVGVDLDVRSGGTTLPLLPTYEHALVVLEGALSLGRNLLEPGRLGYLGTGRDEIRLTAVERTRALLIGGVPFPEPLLMWWNYVARERAEIVAAHAEWTAGGDRFGVVASPLPRMTAAGPPWAART